jgi:hypothetical protein
VGWINPAPGWSVSGLVWKWWNFGAHKSYKRQVIFLNNLVTIGFSKRNVLRGSANTDVHKFFNSKNLKCPSLLSDYQHLILVDRRTVGNSKAVFNCTVPQIWKVTQDRWAQSRPVSPVRCANAGNVLLLQCVRNTGSVLQDIATHYNL